MQVLIAGDNPGLAERVRRLLVDQGIVSDGLSTHTFDDAVDRVVQVRPDAIVVLTEPDRERCLCAIREMRELVPAHTLAVGPGSDPKLILRCLREGAFDYLDEADLQTDLVSRLTRVLTEFKQPHDARGRILSVVGVIGGCGASTLAVNLASALARNYETCGLFDLNLCNGDLASLISLQPQHSIAEFCRNMKRVDQSMFLQCLGIHKSGVHLMAAPKSFADVSSVTTQGVRKALSMAKSCFPYTLVDIDGGYDDVHAQGLFQSDEIVLVLRLDFTVIRQTVRLLEHLADMGISSDRIRLVANRYRRPRELPVQEVEKLLKRQIEHFVPEDARRINDANNRGVPIVIQRPRAKAARSMIDLAWSMNGHASLAEH